MATGYGKAGYLDSVDAIRITEADEITIAECDASIQTYPSNVKYAAGVSLSNGSVVVCGGSHPNNDASKKCFHNNIEGSGKWISSNNLTSQTYGLAMTVIRNTVYVSGGDNGSQRLQDFSKVEDSKWVSLNSLPVSVRHHCLLTLNDTHIINIGGESQNGVSQALNKKYLRN